MLPNLALFLLVEFSHSLLIIYLASGLVLVTIVVELMIVNSELKMIRLKKAIKIGNELHVGISKRTNNLAVKLDSHDLGLDASVAGEDRYVLDEFNMVEFGLKSNPNDSRQNLYSVQ